MSGTPQKEAEGDDKSDGDQQPTPNIPTHTEIEAELERRKAKFIQDRKRREQMAAANAESEKEMAEQVEMPVRGRMGEEMAAAQQWNAPQSMGNHMGVNWGLQMGCVGYTEHGPIWFPGMAFPQSFGGMFNAVPYQQPVPFMAPFFPQLPPIQPPVFPPVSTSNLPPISRAIPSQPSAPRQISTAPVPAPKPLPTSRSIPSQHSASRKIPVVTSLSLKKISAPSVKQDCCGNCGAVSHRLARCPVPDDDGHLRGCPICNIKAHSLADCPKVFIRINAQTVWTYVRANRHGLCPLEFHLDWRLFQDPNDPTKSWRQGVPNRAWYSKQCKANPGCFQQLDPHWTSETMQLDIGSEVTPDARVSIKRKGLWDAVLRSLPPFSQSYFPEKTISSVIESPKRTSEINRPRHSSDSKDPTIKSNIKHTKTPSSPPPKTLNDQAKQNSRAVGHQIQSPQRHSPRPGNIPVKGQNFTPVDKAKAQQDRFCVRISHLKDFNEHRKRPRRSSSTEGVTGGFTLDRRTKRKVASSPKSTNQIRGLRGGDDIQREGPHFSGSAASKQQATNRVDPRDAHNASQRQAPAKGCKRCRDRGCHHCQDR